MSKAIKPLAVIGNVNVDFIMGTVTPWPEPGTEVMASHDSLRPGGSAGNTGLAWQGMGVAYQIAGSTGSDPFGTFLRDAFGKNAARWPIVEARTTVSVGITHPGDERTFLTTTGHLQSFCINDVYSSIDIEAIKGGIIILCGAFQTPVLAGQYEELFAWARANHVEIALDTGWPPAGWTDQTISLVRGWLAHCHHALFNEVEATALSGLDDPERAGALVAGLLAPGGVAVTKLGPRGATAHTGTGEVFRVAAPRVAVIDTIGAGDVFNAGYLRAMAGNLAPGEALRAGIQAASRAISTNPRSYSPDGGKT